jgi:hypothetical protein
MAEAVLTEILQWVMRRKIQGAFAFQVDVRPVGSCRSSIGGRNDWICCFTEHSSRTRQTADATEGSAPKAMALRTTLAMTSASRAGSTM